MSTMAPTSCNGSMAASLAQATAPVLEYQCLFTRDLRQKQKRWQDGRLKYHTFNKRIMVYDERSNNVGDTYWQEDFELGDGEELKLDRGGVLVQVGECIGKKDQDLSDLMGKRVKEKEDRHAARIAAASGSSPAPSVAHLYRPQGLVAPTSSVSKPKPLNAIIGTPSEHYGRAVISTTSPFEERQKLVSSDRGIVDLEERPAKRRRQLASPPSKSGYAQNLFGTTMILSRPPSSAISSTLKTSAKHSSIAPIDLTMDGTKAKGVTSAEKKGFENVVRSSRIEKQRSPPSRSTYAGILPGGALSLSTERNSSTSRCHKIIKAADRDANVSIAAQESALSSDTEGAINEPQRSNNCFVGGPPRTEHKLDAGKTLLRSAPVSFTSESCPSRVRSSSVINASTLGTSLLPLKGPQSALRIKARKPKQMMILMQPPPSSRSASRKVPCADMPSERKTSSASATSKLADFATDRPTSVYDEEELFEGTLTTDLGLQQNDHGRSSSPLYSSIGHQSIDGLSTRRPSVRAQTVIAPRLESRIPRDLETSFEFPPQIEAAAMSRPKLLRSPEILRGNSADAAMVLVLSEEHPVKHCIAENSTDRSMPPHISDFRCSVVTRHEGVQPRTPKALSIPEQYVDIDKNRSRIFDENVNENYEYEEDTGIAITDVDDINLNLEMPRENEEQAQRKANDNPKKLESLKGERLLAQKRTEEARQETARRVALEEAKILAQTQARHEQERQEILRQDNEIAQKVIEDTKQLAARQARLEEERRLDEIRQEVARLQQQKEQEVADQRRRLMEAKKAEEEREKLAKLEKQRELAASQARAEEEKKLAELRNELERMRREKGAEAERQRIRTKERLAEEQREQERIAQEKQLAEAQRKEKEAEAERQRNRTQEILAEAQREQERIAQEKAAEELLRREEITNATTAQVIDQREPCAASLLKAKGITLPSEKENAIQSATDRFRRMIQTPAQQCLTRNPAGRYQVAADIFSRVEPCSDVADTADLLEPPLSRKPSSGRAPSVNSLKDLTESSSFEGASMTSGVTKAFKLSRPVRVQHIDKASEAMLPPGRAGKILENKANGTRDQMATWRKASLDGPWSREAFDLFAWRPPP
ncbi:hypothetical protein BP5796_09625 [Coleophoma crateriformis]|uniref:5'-3' DNA helicase ZGRF1-like N-terminal domain-containing protein n=1 Tax=Coleophoma crateriformis TaxID=565419 RepID=A0A3D8QYK1_9HELO|nr:hypothetical protein BP5796_09625 [Coleophoma crateriformis]